MIKRNIIIGGTVIFIAMLAIDLLILSRIGIFHLGRFGTKEEIRK